MAAMATVLSYYYTSSFVHQGSIGTTCKQFCISKPLKQTTVRALSVAKIRAHSTTIIETEPGNVSTERVGSINKNILACPICYNPLKCNSGSESTVESTAGSSFQCGTCKKSYSSNETYIDLTVASGAKEYTEFKPASTEIFRTPLVSFLYERGWRQNFVWGGFPGPEKEFEMAKGYLNPTIGGNIVDASCGSGLFSRLFAESGLFSLVVALDFSENMLRQCYEFIKQEKSFPKENLILVRADISRLPFVSNSVDAVHAGAALHCWPSPSAAVSEISRVLRPGGVFVATTYILDGIYPAIPVLRILRQSLKWLVLTSNLYALCNDEFDFVDPLVMWVKKTPPCDWLGLKQSVGWWS
ncbi:Methyltransferase type 11 [Macleaya cordata]|uniref:Methyltransferase type 11 n=1 Tax=Macleaya cordata TaxID=56857 RepID=A0A200PM76_MACCD|nr:Methyltransferase type 11 [Macleaya cordata]